MNAYKLEVRAANQPTVLERLMQVSRYRGFRITDLRMRCLGARQLEVAMTVVSRQPLPRLIRQLEKLVDVESVAAESATSGKTRTTNNKRQEYRYG